MADSNQAAPQSRPQKPSSSIGQVIGATRYSIAGLKVALAQRAFRLEVAAFLTIQILFLILGGGVLPHIISFVLFAVLFACEAINTAVEMIVDEISPERSDFAKNTKDLGSFAVSCLLIANAVYAIYVISMAIW